ncbi:integrase [Chitinophaga cymbidii]|uniref:Integrase n=2 Tax=Chitinophaga cymbidii TaxID=1096750 RepID=A0A512RFJ1_9BACT|nr:integrase [Chitinophaga cymbidii]
MDKQGRAPIYVRITVEGSPRAEMSLGKKIYPEDWNPEDECINLHAKNKELALVNTIIKQYRAKLETDYFVLSSQREVVTSQMLKHYFKGEQEKKEEKKEEILPEVYEQIDEYIKVKKGKVSPNTISVYENVKIHLKAFEAFSSKQITFNSFDFNFYDSYVDFLTYHYVQARFKKPVIGLKLNTIGKTIKHLKGFIKDRVRRKIIAPIDLTDFKVPDEESDAIYLTFSEIAAIYYTDLSMYPDLIQDRNRFVVACLTGLRFSDFSTLEKHNLRNGLLYKKQNKSDHWVVIPVREEALKILEEIFKDDIPVSSNPEFNRNIKIIGKLAGINQLITFRYKKGNQDIEVTKAKCDWITSHTGRRSFCTNEFLAETPVKLIMMISGHKKEKDFYRYIRIKPEEAAEILKKIWMARNRMRAFAGDNNVVGQLDSGKTNEGEMEPIREFEC